MGRPWPQPGEPLYLEEDAQDVLDLVADEDDSCPGCGGIRAETFDPANEFAYQGDTRQCFRCAAQRRAERRIDDKDGLYSFAVLRPGHDHH